MKAKVQLSGTKSKTGTDTKQSSLNGDDVNSITKPTKDSVTNQRVKARFHSHGQVFSVGHEGQKKTNETIHNPTMDTPMVQSHIDGNLGKGIVWGGGVSGIPKIRSMNTISKIMVPIYQWYSQGWIWYSLVGIDY